MPDVRRSQHARLFLQLQQVLIRRLRKDDRLGAIPAGVRLDVGGICHHSLPSHETGFDALLYNAVENVAENCRSGKAVPTVLA